MDQTHLGLQNLLYEKRHLEREIEKCRQFAWVSVSCILQSTTLTRAIRSVYQDIPLYSREEFEERAPEEMRTEEILQRPHVDAKSIEL